MKNQKDYQQLSEAYGKLLDENRFGAPERIEMDIDDIDEDPMDPSGTHPGEIDHEAQIDDMREHEQEVKAFSHLIDTVKQVHNHIESDSEAFLHLTGWHPREAKSMPRAWKKSIAWRWWGHHGRD